MPVTAATLTLSERVQWHPRSASLAATTAYVVTALLLVVAPFELLEPVVRLPWQSVSNVELAIVLGGAAWAIALGLTGTSAFWRTPLSAPWAALVASMLVSSLLAPAWRTNALHMTGRLAVAAGVFLMTAAGASTPVRVRRMMTIAALTGVIVAVLAILEFIGVSSVIDALARFRPGVSVVGEQVRAGGPLQYPTIASMYLEIAFAFALGLLVRASVEGDRVAVGAWIAGLLVLAEAVVVTFTRAGMITVGASLLLVAATRFRRGSAADLAFRATVAVAVLIVVEAIASHSSQATRLRLTSEAQDAWYRAEIHAPAVFDFAPDATIIVPITVTNSGRVTWDSAVAMPFRLSYHWVMRDDDRVVAYEGLRTEFPEPVAPGSTVTLHAPVRAPRQPGQYRLLWDIAEEGRLWFTTEPGAQLFFSTAIVGGAPATFTDLGALRLLPRPAARPGRFVLWRAAARMLAVHPLLGVGPDNYRLSYGAYAGIANADPRVHTNDMYLEVAVGAGLAGTIAFAWLLWMAARTFRQALARSLDRHLPEIVGIVAAGVAILAHGLVDSFLSFTPIYVLIAVTVGLAVASARKVAADANRL